MDAAREVRSSSYKSRRSFSEECRVADLTIDKTSSWPEGLEEDYRFLPFLPRPGKRSSSAGDVEKYKDYFLVAQNNQGNRFTWNYYMKILHDDLRHFGTHLLLKKLSIRNGSPSKSETSNYTTASETTISKMKRLEGYKFNKRICQKAGSDADSASSAYGGSNFFSTTSIKLLKKMCSEIRTIAYETCKNVEQMSLSKCSKPFVDDKKPISPSTLKSSKTPKRRLSNFELLRITTPNGSGVYPVSTPVCRKLRFTPQSTYKVNKSFTKKGRKTLNKSK